MTSRLNYRTRLISGVSTNTDSRPPTTKPGLGTAWHAQIWLDVVYTGSSDSGSLVRMCIIILFLVLFSKLYLMVPVSGLLLQGETRSNHPLNLLPLMYLYELFNVLFFVKCLKFPNPSFIVEKFITFSSSSTRPGSAAKLVHKRRSTSSSHHFTFAGWSVFWNSLPPIDLTLSFSTTKQVIKQHFWTIML